MEIGPQLIAYDQPTEATQPSEGAFDDPAIRPIGRFGSGMVLLLSSGLPERGERSAPVRPSSDGDVGQQCRGADTPASALPPPHRPTQASAATHRTLSALAPGPVGSRTAG